MITLFDEATLFEGISMGFRLGFSHLCWKWFQKQFCCPYKYVRKLVQPPPPMTWQVHNVFSNRTHLGSFQWSNSTLQPAFSEQTDKCFLLSRSRKKHFCKFCWILQRSFRDIFWRVKLMTNPLPLATVANKYTVLMTIFLLGDKIILKWHIFKFLASSVIL